MNGLCPSIKTAFSWLSVQPNLLQLEERGSQIIQQISRRPQHLPVIHLYKANHTVGVHERLSSVHERLSIGVSDSLKPPHIASAWVPRSRITRSQTSPLRLPPSISPGLLAELPSRLGHLGLQYFQPTPHGLQIMPEPYCNAPSRRDAQNLRLLCTLTTSP